MNHPALTNAIFDRELSLRSIRPLNVDVDVDLDVDLDVDVDDG